LAEPAKNTELQLLDAIEQFVYDPLGFVCFAYPWGSGILVGEEGPDKWQAEILDEIGEKALAQAEGTLTEAIRIARRSGHGIGKTALIAWIIHWFLSTRPHPQAVITANTKTQLETKTWRELGKWHKLSINQHWFTWTATKFYLNEHPETWFAAAIPWSKDRPEAFAGTHEKYVLYIFDEASDIPDIIFETAEGALTTEGAIIIAFGNPTRNDGRFREFFGRFRHRWAGKKIDARQAKKANQAQLQQWIDDYGIDSDFCRIRITGDFPRAGSTQLIPVDLVEAAMQRDYTQTRDVWRIAPVVIGVDVARFGEDQSVICVRQGLHIHSFTSFRGIDIMHLASEVAIRIKKYNPQAVFVDVVGMGAGVVDRLRQLGFGIIEVNAGEKAVDNDKYYNLRAEMWNNLKTWLSSRGSLPDNDELKQDLIGVQYGFDVRERLQLEKKTDMKKRGLASPDFADALAMTFAMPTQIVQDEDVLPEFEEDL